MMSSSPASEKTTECSAKLDAREVREMALFMVRVFDEEASEVAAQRARKSDQADDWRRVGAEIDRLIAEAPLDELAPHPLPLFAGLGRLPALQSLLRASPV
jgi:hypothetical protein